MVLVSCLLSMHCVLCLSSPCNLLPGHDVYHVQGMDWRQTCSALAQLSTEQQPAKDGKSSTYVIYVLEVPEAGPVEKRVQEV
ncbi:hypothetical protein JKP88DRAFT_8701 [Tribonema minus]|uniref:Uncharacterized protein n=1 Tax=Tribonema minus TaxID=303371 RepID=A0A836CNH9_9STRA|nr:hypothetical protein JKP88DRAFT_8701 [Tribonema minus]